MYYKQDEFLYHPSNADFYNCEGFDNYSKIDYKGTRFYYGNIENHSRVIVYYSGNGGRACDRFFLRQRFERYDSALIFVEYTGFGGDDLEPSKELLLGDARNVAEFIEKENYSRVIGIGESLGTSVVSYQSSISDVDTLILLAPFYSTYSLGREMYPQYPISFLEIENYDTATWLENYDGRLVIIHGNYDKNIPISQARELYDYVNTKDKHLFQLTFAKHNDLYTFWDTYRALRYAIDYREYDSLEELRYNSTK